MEWRILELGDADEFALMLVEGVRARWIISFRMNGEMTVDQQREIARQISAVPEMLAALQQIKKEMDAGFGSSFGETRESVRRAIAKATRP